MNIDEKLKKLIDKLEKIGIFDHEIESIVYCNLNDWYNIYNQDGHCIFRLNIHAYNSLELDYI